MSDLFKHSYILLIGLLVPLQACSNTYSAKPIEAWVVDSETKQPLEGVIVVALWELRYGLEGGGAYPLTVMEAVTDKNGRFYFPAWGPKKIPEHLPYEARLKDWDPAMVFYKKDYTYLMLTNDRPIRSMSGHGDSTRTSEWNGKTIPLTKFRGSIEAYELNVLEFVYFVDAIVETVADCNWKQIPRLLHAFGEEERRFVSLGLSRFSHNILSYKHFSHSRQCESAFTTEKR